MDEIGPSGTKCFIHNLKLEQTSLPKMSSRKSILGRLFETLEKRLLVNEHQRIFRLGSTEDVATAIRRFAVPLPTPPALDGEEWLEVVHQEAAHPAPVGSPTRALAVAAAGAAFARKVPRILYGNSVPGSERWKAEFRAAAEQRAPRKEKEFCVFCKNNKRPAREYLGHTRKNCGVLLAYECTFCHRRGHTKRYCPQKPILCD